ncbi:hypothetical protein [Cryobacterium sp. 10C2]|nr:hypothetical protein [Cryobacterium sp. 10C2]MDY7526663.1 hypothetical protein [Cryobacterium sp. 10C2]
MLAKVRRVVTALAVVGLIGTLLTTTPQPATALSGSEFDPGYIISDAQFYSRDAMSQDQIQGFLNAQGGSCNDALCLRSLRLDTPSVAAEDYCSAYAGAAGESAASIIFKVQAACNISAKVILVTLQKEQALVTRSSTSDAILRKAMGMGCPDTSVCDAQYYGFFNQVYAASRQFNRYNHGSFTWYKVGGTSNVQYSPTASCGSSPVQIKNSATAALYYYTPYQPNASALANLGGAGDGCGSYGNRNFWVFYTNWFGSPTGNGNPFGFVDGAVAVMGGIQIGGWAIDPDSTSPIEVHVYVDGVGTRTVADNARADIGNAYPGFGSAHGFSATVPVVSSGNHTICAYAINVGRGSTIQLGCLVVAARGGSPVGMLEGVSTSVGSVTASGWAIDPDTAASIAVHVYVDAVGVPVLANGTRTDVGAANPGYGNAHGYSATVSTGPGSHSVCAYGINVANGSNTQLGCQTVNVLGEQGRAPTGVLETVRAVTGGIGVTGWALDPDTASSIAVHVYVDGVGTAYVANKARPDVGAAYVGYGDNHGFAETVAASPGSHSVCAYGINAGPGPNTLIRCTTVTVPGATGIVELGRAPFGSLEAVQVVAGGVQASGWAIDPDTASPIAVHVYVDGTGVAFVADKIRTDVGAAYSGYGNNHGFSETVAAAAGSHRVCVYGINSGSGVNTQIGCTTVTVPGATGIVELGRAPFGSLEAVQVVAGGVQASGWAIDPDTASPIAVHVYVDGTGVAFVADKVRTDVGAAYSGYGNNHGFSETVAAAAGSHRVCVYGINSGSGVNTQIGCTTVTVPGATGIVELGRAPFGSLEAVQVVAGGVQASGWAIDPDTASPIAVHVYVDGTGVAFVADKVRTDVGAAYSGYGNNHGFSETVAAAAGSHRVCVYGINSGSGVNTQIGCTTVTVPGATGIVELGRAPFGSLEAVQVVAGGVQASGWAIDPDTASPIAVHVYVDGTGVAFVADKVRTDVGAAYSGYGNNHGFSETVAAAAGSHRVCVYGINSGSGVNTQIGCTTVTVQ